MDYLYDFVHGIQVIEEKRDRVRFEYGKALQVNLGALKGPRSQGRLVTLSYAF